MNIGSLLVKHIHIINILPISFPFHFLGVSLLMPVCVVFVIGIGKCSLISNAVALYIMHNTQHFCDMLEIC